MTFHNSPNLFVDPDGESPISIFVKAVAKIGIKKATKQFVKRQIKKRLRAYMSKKWAKQLGKDALDFIDVTTSTEWYDYVIEIVPVVGDAYGAAKLGKQGYAVWRGVEKFKAVMESTSHIAKLAWKKLDVARGVLDKGSDRLKTLGKKLNDQGTHLGESDLAGAVKELFGLKSGFKANGKPFQHLKEVKDAIGGMSKTLKTLKKEISSGKFEGKALESAKGMYEAGSKQFNDVVRSYNSAVKKSNKLKDVKISK